MGYKIKEARQDAGLTQDELANRSGVSRSIINGLETGRTTVTTNVTLLKIAKALNRKIADIFFED